MYRGKRKDTGEWVYGYLIGKDVIVGDIVELCEEYFNCEYWWRVDPETVGQSTGLKDKNGKEIYEGDILKLVLIDYVNEPESLLTVRSESFHWDVCYLQSIVKFIEESGSETDSIEVIGNVFENGELLNDCEEAKTD